MFAIVATSLGVLHAYPIVDGVTYRYRYFCNCCKCTFIIEQATTTCVNDTCECTDLTQDLDYEGG